MRLRLAALTTECQRHFGILFWSRQYCVVVWFFMPKSTASARVPLNWTLNSLMISVCFIATIIQIFILAASTNFVDVCIYLLYKYRIEASRGMKQMLNKQIPKTIAKWIVANGDKVETHWMELDEFGERHEGPYSIWLYLQHGLCNYEQGSHIIHEATAKAFIEQTKFIEPCPCTECKATK
jgi:hypothetical protein